jgi:hypothetical protein
LSREALAPFAATFSVTSPRSDASTDPIDLQGDADRAFNSPWRKLPPLTGRRGVTALAGQVLLLDGQPLPHVRLEIGSRRTRTDRTGRFLLELPGASSGWQELLIEGTTANRPGAQYGIFEVAVQLVGGETAALPYTIWMPRIDTANAVRIDSATTREVVITTPHIPGLELHLPRHTVITDHTGEVVREVSITPIPVDRPPFPLPAGVQVPVYFTIQPGGAYLTTHAYGSGRKGPWLVYPNYSGKAPGYSCGRRCRRTGCGLDRCHSGGDGTGAEHLGPDDRVLRRTGQEERSGFGVREPNRRRSCRARSRSLTIGR